MLEMQPNQGNNVDCGAVKCITQLSDIWKWNLWVLLGSKRPCGDIPTRILKKRLALAHISSTVHKSLSLPPSGVAEREATVQPWDRLMNRGVKVEEIA